MNSKVLEYIEGVQKCRKNYLNGDYGKMDENAFKLRMSERFNDFSENYPTIFEKTVTGYFESSEEFNRLKYAMGLIDKTNKGEIEKEDGEKQFGQVLVDLYVKPNVPDSFRNKTD
jgi:hypothetical protein